MYNVFNGHGRVVTGTDTFFNMGDDEKAELWRCYLVWFCVVRRGGHRDP